MSEKYYVGENIFRIKILNKEELKEERKYTDEWNKEFRNRDRQQEAPKAIRLREQCDEYYEEEYSKKEAIELFEDILRWIKETAFDED
jgi:hypothetical protein